MSKNRENQDEPIGLNELPDVLKEPAKYHQARTGGSFEDFYKTLEYLEREEGDSGVS